MSDDVKCPKCGGACWDNRATKRNPKQPDFKCKDKACDGVIWPPKGQAAPVAAAPQAKQAYSSGPAIAGLDDAPDADPSARLDKLFGLYAVCYSQALATIRKAFPNEAPSQVAVCAATATLFIAARDRGMAA